MSRADVSRWDVCEPDEIASEDRARHNRYLDRGDPDYREATESAEPRYTALTRNGRTVWVLA